MTALCTPTDRAGNQSAQCSIHSHSSSLALHLSSGLIIHLVTKLAPCLPPTSSTYLGPKLGPFQSPTPCILDVVSRFPHPAVSFCPTPALRVTAVSTYDIPAAYRKHPARIMAMTRLGPTSQASNASGSGGHSGSLQRAHRPGPAPGPQLIQSVQQGEVFCQSLLIPKEPDHADDVSPDSISLHLSPSLPPSLPKISQCRPRRKSSMS